MIWREPRDCESDFYFSIVNPFQHGMSTNKKRPLKYPIIPFRPDQYVTGLDEVYSREISVEPVQQDSKFTPKGLVDKLYRISRSEMSDLIRDLGLSNRISELLA